MLNFYKVSRNDDVGWDEYDSAVIVAESPEDAIAFLKAHYEDWETDTWGEWDVSAELVEPNEKKIVIKSFNAG